MARSESFRRSLAALVVLGLAAWGCGSSTVMTEASMPSTAPSSEPVELSLRTGDGRVVELADQRGAPVLLCVLATYDGVSQAAMRSASRFARAHEDVLVLGVLAQPDAAQFAPLFEEAMGSPFAITFEPAGTITGGSSALGTLQAVPSFYALDASGRVVERHVGFLSERDLERIMEDASH